MSGIYVLSRVLCLATPFVPSPVSLREALRAGLVGDKPPFFYPPLSGGELNPLRPPCQGETRNSLPDKGGLPAGRQG